MKNQYFEQGKYLNCTVKKGSEELGRKISSINPNTTIKGPTTYLAYIFIIDTILYTSYIFLLYYTYIIKYFYLPQTLSAFLSNLSFHILFLYSNFLPPTSLLFSFIIYLLSVPVPFAFRPFFLTTECVTDLD
jgi:hypothetical protein